MNPFLDWLADVENDPPVMEAAPAGLLTEARHNLWTFTLTEPQAQEVRPEEVLRFLQAVIAARARQITEKSGRQHPMVFYCWFDEQACQLRFSLVSACHHRLPFRGRVNRDVELAAIVEAFLASPFHQGLPLESDPAVVTDGPSGLSVWAKQIPD